MPVKKDKKLKPKRKLASNTASKQAIKKPRVPNKGSFVKGDVRINRKGRPKTFDELRSLALEVAVEAAVDDNGRALKFPGQKEKLNKIKAILLDWAISDDPKKQAKFIEYAFGKVPDKTEMTGLDGKDLIPKQSYTEEELKKEIIKRGLGNLIK